MIRLNDVWNWGFCLNVFVWLWYKEVLIFNNWVSLDKKVICLFRELIIVICNLGKVIFKGMLGNFVFELILYKDKGCVKFILNVNVSEL